jgi:threonine dehydrogenase-like Zn-dependent dehydrogenase
MAGVNYAGFSDPVMNASLLTGYVATLKAAPGQPATTAANNKALIFGVPLFGAQLVARTGGFAPDSAGNNSTVKYSAITNFALPGGALSSPIFVAKLAGPGITVKNNVAVFARDTNGTVRRLMQTGQKLSSQTVSKITLLKATPQAFAAQRSFNKDGGVVMLLGFTDHTTGILRVDVP